jgi:hypothetical protein
MTKVRLITALSLGTMLFAACDKQLEENPTPRSASQSSTAKAEIPGNWQLVAFKGVVPTSNSAAPRVTNIFAMLSDCKKDDKLNFEPTGGLTEVPGAVECEAEVVDKSAKSDAAKPGSWTLSADGQTLTLTQGQAKEYQVVSLSATTLKLRSAGALDQPYTELEYKR